MQQTFNELQLVNKQAEDQKKHEDAIANQIKCDKHKVTEEAQKTKDKQAEHLKKAKTDECTLMFNKEIEEAASYLHKQLQDLMKQQIKKNVKQRNQLKRL